MAYMAPEVLGKRGYLSSVDWWSLGVTAYELLFGRRPFRGKTNSALTHSIMNDRCGFPENVDTIVSRETISCIKGMLERDTRKRMGCRNGLEDFKAHPWFANLDWDALMAKQLKPPFEPDSKKANFDATHELEELLLEDNPLKARKRDEKRDINSLAPEMRQMEEHFLPFDHLKQVRRSYFKSPKARERTLEEQQQTSSTTYTLQDQPLADMSGSASQLNGTHGGHGMMLAPQATGGSSITGPSGMLDPRGHDRGEKASMSRQGYGVDDGRGSDLERLHSNGVSSSGGNGGALGFQPHQQQHPYGTPRVSSSMDGQSREPNLMPTASTQQQTGAYAMKDLGYAR